MDLLNIPNVQRQLERLADLLNKIQKDLGEYLERERTSFPQLDGTHDGKLIHCDWCDIPDILSIAPWDWK